MEKNNTYGIYFNWKDIEELIEEHLNWIEVVEDQVLCITNVMNDQTPIGTSIAVRVDGIKCQDDDDTLILSLSNGIYTLPVKTVYPNDMLDVRFDRAASVPGTYGCIVDGVLDILTEEEKEFKKYVDELLEYRSDEYANKFRTLNTRNVGGRGLLLLEKIKAEIRSNDILLRAGVTPNQLIASFVEMTGRYISTCENIEKLTNKLNTLSAQYEETFEEDSRNTKRLARDIEMVSRKIESNRDVANYCIANIEAVIMPVLMMDIGH